MHMKEQLHPRMERTFDRIQVGSNAENRKLNSLIFLKDLQIQWLGIVDEVATAEVKEGAADRLRVRDVKAPTTLRSFPPSDQKRRTNGTLFDLAPSYRHA